MGSNASQPASARSGPGFDTDPHVAAPRYLTADVPGVGGSIKEHDEDFVVEEIPLYPPCGEGEHIYLFVEKRGLSTVQMINKLARHFRVRPGAIGTAGLKDKRAVTRQVVSIHTPGRSPEDFPSVESRSISVLWADLHTNKLRRGHLAGNRFSIKIRGCDPVAVIGAKKSLERLADVGVPNRFGVQRFGYMQNNHLIGRALLLRRPQDALDLLLGPNPLAPDSQQTARDAYARGDIRAAHELFPPMYRSELVALNALRQGHDADEAFAAIDPTAAGFFISGFQSAVFNRVLNARVLGGALSRLEPGDVAFVHKSRSTFAVTDGNVDESDLLDRVASFQISPSGPMWGSEMKAATGDVGRREIEALEAMGVTRADLDGAAHLPYDMVRGDRRPLRIPVIDPDIEAGLDGHGAYIRCSFQLPRGSFATTVMDEIMKTPLRGPDA